MTLSRRSNYRAIEKSAHQHASDELLDDPPFRKPSGLIQGIDLRDVSALVYLTWIYCARKYSSLVSP